jgi:hypothetical protein
MLKFKSFLKEELLTVRTQHYLLEEDILEEEWLLLSEESANEKVEADDKGKLFEVLHNGYMHGGTEEKFHADPNKSPTYKFPEHHRAESENPDHAGTPQQVHDKLRKKIGEEAYAQINKDAHESSQKTKEQLKKDGHIGKDGLVLGDSYWTSNPDKVSKSGENIMGDHQRTRGIHDPNFKGDGMYEIHKIGPDGKKIMDPETGKPKVFDHLGGSAKYGFQKKANHSNNGLDKMEKFANLPAGSLDLHQNEHKTAMDDLKYNGSADQRNIQTKIDEMPVEDTTDAKGKVTKGILSMHKELSDKHAQSPLKDKEKLMHEHLGKFIEAGKVWPGGIKSLKLHAEGRAARARKSADDTTKVITKQVADGLKGSSSETPEAKDTRLRNMMRQLVSPPSVTKTYFIKTTANRKKDGPSDHTVKPLDSLADEHLSRFKNLDISHRGANNLNVTGELHEPGHPKHGQRVNVSTLSCKTGSGAHKGRVFTTKLENEKNEQ